MSPTFLGHMVGGLVASPGVVDTLLQQCLLRVDPLRLAGGRPPTLAQAARGAVRFPPACRANCLNKPSSAPPGEAAGPWGYPFLTAQNVIRTGMLRFENARTHAFGTVHKWSCLYLHRPYYFRGRSRENCKKYDKQGRLVS